MIGNKKTGSFCDPAFFNKSTLSELERVSKT